jgi:hypothetical protein
MRRAHLAWRLSSPKRTRSKKRDAHTQLHIIANLACFARRSSRNMILPTCMRRAHLASCACCWSRHLILPTCTRRSQTAPCCFLKYLLLLIFSFRAGRHRRACCNLPRRNLAHGHGQRYKHQRACHAAALVCSLRIVMFLLSLSLFLSLYLIRARRSGAGDALACALVRAASLTACAHSRASFIAKQMAGPQYARRKCLYAVTMCLAKRPTRALYVHKVGE